MIHAFAIRASEISLVFEIKSFLKSLLSEIVQVYLQVVLLNDLF